MEERHRTLRATIAWSYDLLHPREAELMRCLAVFRGAFETAAVTSVALRSEDENLETIEALVDKSLVSLTSGLLTSRYILPDTVRDFVAEALRADGSLDVLSGRHFDHYARLVSSKALQSGGTDIGTRLNEVAASVSNLRAALEWGLAHRPVAAAEMATGLSLYWKIRGHVTEGRAWFRRLLESAEITGVVRAALLRRAASFATLQDEYGEARELSVACMELYEAASDVGGVAEALHNLAVIEQRCGNSGEAAEHYAAALERFRLAGHQYGQFVALANMALLAFERDDLVAAEAYIDEAARIAAATGDSDHRATATAAGAELALRKGDLESAGRLYGEALALKRSVGNAYDEGDIQNSLSIVYMRQGRMHDALEAARQTMQLGLELDSGSLVIFAFEAFCELGVENENFEDAARYFGLARNLRRAYSYEPSARKMNVTEQRLRAGLQDRFESTVAVVDGADWRAIAAGLAEGE
jgi:tetratricopeptide (TPR) repeat protein